MRSLFERGIRKEPVFEFDRENRVLKNFFVDKETSEYKYGELFDKRNNRFLAYYFHNDGHVFVRDPQGTLLVSIFDGNKWASLREVCACYPCRRVYRDVFGYNMGVIWSYIKMRDRVKWIGILRDLFEMGDFFKPVGNCIGGIDTKLLSRREEIDTLEQKVKLLTARVATWKSLGFYDYIDANLASMRDGRLVCKGQFFIEVEHDRIDGRFVEHPEGQCDDNCVASKVRKFIDKASKELLTSEDVDEYNACFDEERFIKEVEYDRDRD